MLWVLINEYPQHVCQCCGYSLESPRQGDSIEYPQRMFLWRNNQNYPLIITKYPPSLSHCHSFNQSAYLVKCKYTCPLTTVMILSFQTDRPGQTVQTQIRLLLEEQSDQGLHCLPFRLHRLDSLLYGRAT